ncbi:MAG: hypothetical protein ABL914_08350 [Novosphingobium sp.]|uniref:hypothetical protein n=1 Tax=Novosphingobium sp. TaxID=1874826 RepID=UPI0032BDF576
MKRISEAELDHAFAELIELDPVLQRFLLDGGRFGHVADTARLLVDDQRSARKAKHWWKHWWCKLPDGSAWETDIFLVFETETGRFAIHIENKPSDGNLRFEQAAAYRRRATFKANDPSWLNYWDFETILMAPSSFLAENTSAAAQFDRSISYEDIAAFIPLFSLALE